MSRWIICCLACVGLSGFPSGLRAAQPAAQDSLVERVNKAIDAGVRFLYDEEKGTGNWESIDLASQTRPGGWTALATLALLNSGVKPNEAIIVRSLTHLRTVEPQHTYVVGLQIMVFAEAGRSEDRERIQQLVDWLIKARTMSGQ
ncbi:MAG TPA: hypothetical protein VGP68_10450, partial [Gemmataceae bacterium]|nr:hypothetical protein [Gemmataceae bacterium]